MVGTKTNRFIGAALAAGGLTACGGASAPDASEPLTETASIADETSGATADATPAAEPESVPTLDTSAIVASGPSDAIAQINARDEMRRRIAVETGQNIGQIPLDVSWPYGPCTDAASLIPPPRDGWRLFALSAGEWPQNADMARITYSSVDETLTPGTPEYGASKQNFSVHISSGTGNTQGMKDTYSNPQMAEMLLEPGPYNYPIRKMPAGFPGRGVLLGEYFVQLDGTGKDMDAYFSTIIKCGIDSGLIADGVDPATLVD